MAALCADCDGCCRVFEVKEVSKPFNVPCKHLGQTLLGPGCSIYAERPEACQHYVCLWLDGERRRTPLGEALRPNVCKVVIVLEKRRISITGDMAVFGTEEEFASILS